MIALNFAQAQLLEREKTSSETDLPLVDEDEDLLPQTRYVFNPIQAKKNMKIGNFYARKGNNRAAAARYLEATRWDPGYTEAYWHLGRSREKLKQPSDAVEAYQEFLRLAPNHKRANKVRQRIPALQHQIETEKPTQKKP